MKIYHASLDFEWEMCYDGNEERGEAIMIHTDANSFQKSFAQLLAQTIRYGEPVNISTENGNAVLLSEADYNNLIATLELSEIPGMKQTIREGLQTPLNACLTEESVQFM